MEGHSLSPTHPWGWKSCGGSRGGSPVPQNTPTNPLLCTSPPHTPIQGFPAKHLGGLVLTQQRSRFPLEEKKEKKKEKIFKKKASFSHGVQKAKSLPRNISERSGVPLPAAPASSSSSRTPFPLFILKIFLR